MNILTCPLPTLQRLLRALAEDRNRIAFARVGVHHAQSDHEWLVRNVTISRPGTVIPDQEPLFHITLTSTRPSIPPDPLPSAVVGHLYLGDGPRRGHLWGIIRTDEAIEPLHRLSLVGAGMHSIQILNPHVSKNYPSLDDNTVNLRERIELVRSTASEVFPSLRQAQDIAWDGLGTLRGRFFRDEVAKFPSREGLGVGSFPLPEAIQARWSRTIGALGGEAIWERLTRLRIALIGCGRTGSLAAVTLTRLGMRQLTLIDPDIVEVHNLGEMDAVTEADLGRPKAEAIAGHLRSLLKPRLSSRHRVFPSIVPVVNPITDPPALNAAKECDVLFCCADNDSARLATAILATLYHKVLIDIGAGIFYRNQSSPPHTHRTMGADIRLILPGDGCLLCRGNLSNYAQALENLCNYRVLAGLQQREWNQQRAGSLRSLNQLAAALGVQLLQDLVAERIQASTWAHVEFDNAGRLTLNYPPAPQPTDVPTCALCLKAGLGDQGLMIDD